jgi:CelD/BcsL family acetyltransferase involved in cellulose biosynthesis
MKELQIIPFAQIIEQDWTNFHQSCIDPVMFYQYPFISAYSETTNESVEVLVYKEDGKTLIALPGKFDEKKRIFSNLSFLGWDNLNFLIVNDLFEKTLRMFFSELFKFIDLIIYKNISQSCQQTITQCSGSSIFFKGFRCPFINLPTSYQTYLETISSSSKRMINRKTNFCQRNGVKFRFLSNINKESMEDAIMELNRLHMMRMDEVAMESKFLKSDSQKFHRIIHDYNNNEFILIVQAIKDEKVIGTFYGFVSSNRYAYFASGIDPNFSEYSIGTALMAKVIDYSISKGYEYFDFLRGTENYKFKWTKETNQNYTVYSFANISGKFKAIKKYWLENKLRLGKKQTLVNLKRFF